MLASYVGFIEAMKRTLSTIDKHNITLYDRILIIMGVTIVKPKNLNIHGFYFRGCFAHIQSIIHLDCQISNEEKLGLSNWKLCQLKEDKLKQLRKDCRFDKNSYFLQN